MGNSVKRTKRMRARRLTQGLCPHCGTDSRGSKFRYCEKYRRQRRRWRRRRHEQRGGDLCNVCLRQPAQDQLRSCRHCREMKRKAREKLRDEVYAAYGGYRCKFCDETRIEALQIDHVADDGADHRRRIGRGGQALYSWLKRHNYPSGFQVLCASCNTVKRICGFVPPVAEHRRQGCLSRRVTLSK